MKRFFQHGLLLGAIWLLGSQLAFAAHLPSADSDGLVIRFVDAKGVPIVRASTTLPDVIRLNGTGAEANITVSATGLTQDIVLRVDPGFEVTPTTIAAGTEAAAVTVRHTSCRNHTDGRLILRSGDIRTYVSISAEGTPLASKDLLANNAAVTVFDGSAVESQSFDAAALNDAGFTIEIKARTDDPSKSVLPYAVTASGLGFKSYVRSTSMGLMNGKNVFVSEKGLSNPANGGTFYNTDGLFHTYRYAVTPDRRIFVYRDGMPIDTFRVADLALQPEWSETNGAMVPNLIKNGDFEGEYNFSESQNITKFIEGWDVYPYDQYNSYQDIDREERSNEVDQNNHVLSIHRYMWNDGWADAEISQIVDVAPNETYAFSALAKGGQYSGSALGSIRIQDLQNDGNNVRLNVTSDNYETYASDFETKANTKQVRVTFQLGRAKWGASTSAFKVDDVKMVGVSRIPTAQVGFENLGADIQYFAIDPTGAYAPPFAAITTSTDALVINGTGASETFTVSAENLTGDLTLTATHGFEVTPAKLPAGTQNATVTVKHLTTLIENTGRIILRSGDLRKEVKLTAYGSPLNVKDLLANNAAGNPSPAVTVFDGSAVESQSFDATTLNDNGFTIEIKARTDDPSKSVLPYAVTASGLGFKSYVRSTSMGLMNGKNVFVSEKGLSNPANGGTFYNTDGLFHTYRYAVTPDRRIFVYRDGMPIDTFRVADLALQPEWSETNGAMVPNLIKNGDFEGEYNFSESQNITKFIEGWDVYPYDQYNSYQDIDREERSNEVDQNNHVLSIHRYMWNDGWADAEISQIVDVAPNETYAFSALAKGGQYSGSALGSIRIQDLQNDGNNVRLNVTSDNYETYASDFETKANTKQVRVTFQLGRAKWGASTSAFKVDDVKMVGVSRIPTAQVGFENLGADIQYFAIDPTGAYAPPFAAITTSTDALVINGTGASETFTVSAENLTGDLTLTATHGFEVSPAKLPAGTQNATVTVKHITTLIENTGRIILRSGDLRKEVKLTAYGSPLNVKDLLANNAAGNPSTAVTVFDGSAVESQSFDATTLNDAGFTIEIKARTDDPSKSVLPYAVTASGLGFKSYVRSTSMGLMNGKNVFVSEKGLSNPANGGTFYNTDGLFHTYRYAVTPDRRIFVYRDGLPIDTFRVADLALQPEWSETNGAMVPNLIKNGDFEGEYNFSESQNITKFIEGWDVYPYDQYNSYQDIDREERSNEVDQNNHVLSIHRYMWNDGWADAEISQIVDVAPNETYAFSALAKGGQYSGSALGSIRIQDLQNDGNNVRLNVTSDNYETYASDFETKANTKQVRVTFQLGRAKWGASTSAFKVDDVKMVGVSRIPTAQVGFENLGADIQYFAIDPTGAYAPPFAAITTSTDALVINGTGASETFTVSAENLTGDLTLNATHGFEVSPAKLPAGTQNATVTVKHVTTLIENTGRIILRSGDFRKEVKLTAYGSPLNVKDLLANNAAGNPSTAVTVFDGSAVESQSFDAAALNDNGFTIEIKARTDDPSKSVLPYAVTASGLGFKSYVRSTSMGLMNGKNVFVSEKGLSNPANGGTFYNTDGLFHTYRYAVTPDRRIFVYRDGLPIDTFRVADLALQPEWSETDGPVMKNLLKNGNFEGEYNFSESQNITKFIEGWDVYPYDQYNSYQDIDREERSNEVDQNNHVLSIHRYMWNDGWADAEISQIVDVASDDIYTFSALAKGGQYDGSALGSIRIQDLQNDDNNARLNVTSDSYQKYSVDFETKANTKQIRITFQLGRAKWGASTSAFKIDDARLIGTSRIPTAQVGFENLGADIEYFAIDATGAYAPVLPGLTVKDIQDAIQTAHSNDGNFRGRLSNRQLELFGVEDHSRVVVYDPSGQEVAAVNDYTGQASIALPRRGIYIVAVFKDGKKKVIKVM